MTVVPFRVPEPQQAPPPDSAPPPRKKRSLRELFLHLVGRDDPPEVVAASFALGVAISFTPLFGLHFWMAILMAFALKLNKVDVVLGTLVVNPLTFGPVSAAAIPIGRMLLRARKEAMTHLPWSEMLSRSFWESAGPRVRAIGVQWTVGMFALSFLAGALTYAVLVRVLRSRRARLAPPAPPLDTEVNGAE